MHYGSRYHTGAFCCREVDKCSVKEYNNSNYISEGIAMKKNKKTALMAAILTGAAMLTGCDHGSDNPQDVYGPPPATENPSAYVTVPAVYGPPPTDEFVTDPVTEPVTTEYEPSGDDIQVVYGPPETPER